MKMPFTPDQFLEVFKNYNQAIYPIQIVLFLLAIVAFFLAIKPGPKSDNYVSGILSFLWIWMGVVYHLIYFTKINNGSYLFSVAFVLQGVLFFSLGVLKKSLSFKFRANLNGLVGVFLIGFALIIYPALGYLLKHSYPDAPTFGLPCPTTIFTFGILLFSAKSLPLWILIIPFLWSIIGFQAALSFGFYEDIGLIISGILAVSLLVYRNRLIDNSVQFSNLVKKFFMQSKSITKQSFSFAQISALPAPVQRYFKLVLKEGQAHINYARLLHDGNFKTDRKKKWVQISGEQYFTTSNPGFIWKGVSSLFTARDMYIDGKGSLVVSLLSFFKIVDGNGDKYNQGELLRWLGESVWFPTNFLTSEKLRWTEVDDLTANLAFFHNGLKLHYVVTFNIKGEITQIETQRYMDKEHLETWIGKISEYKQINGVVVPMTIEAIWRLVDGDFSYAKFYVKKLEYDTPEEWPNDNT